MTLDELMNKYHWVENPELFDDLKELEECTPYLIVGTLYDKAHKHGWCEVGSWEKKTDADDEVKRLRADPMTISVSVCRGTKLVVFVRVGPAWEKMYRGEITSSIA